MIYLSLILEEFAGSLMLESTSQHSKMEQLKKSSSRFRTWLASCLAPQLVLIGSSLPFVSLSPSEICHWLVQWKIKLFDTSRAGSPENISKRKRRNIDPFATQFLVFRPWVSRNSWIWYTNFGCTSKSSPKFRESCEAQDLSFLSDTRWAPASDKWGDGAPMNGLING